MIIDTSNDLSSYFNYSLKFVIRPSFDDNKNRLYDLELIGNSESLKKSPRTNFEATQKLKVLYCKKYGEPLYEDGSTEYVDKYSDIRFYWFSGRQEIKLEYLASVNSIRISYLDLILWNQIGLEFQNDKIKGINKTLNEI